MANTLYIICIRQSEFVHNFISFIDQTYKQMIAINLELLLLTWYNICKEWYQYDIYLFVPKYISSSWLLYYTKVRSFWYKFKTKNFHRIIPSKYLTQIFYENSKAHLRNSNKIWIEY